jgi:hypothetical protein
MDKPPGSTNFRPIRPSVGQRLSLRTGAIEFRSCGLFLPRMTELRRLGRILPDGLPILAIIRDAPSPFLTYGSIGGVLCMPNPEFGGTSKPPFQIPFPGDCRTTPAIEIDRLTGRAKALPVADSFDANRERTKQCSDAHDPRVRDCSEPYCAPFSCLRRRLPGASLTLS